MIMFYSPRNFFDVIYAEHFLVPNNIFNFFLVPLASENGIKTQKNNCITCYRCVNKCPEKAITVFVRGRVKKQYKELEK